MISRPLSEVTSPNCTSVGFICAPPTMATGRSTPSGYRSEWIYHLQLRSGLRLRPSEPYRSSTTEAKTSERLAKKSLLVRRAVSLIIVCKTAIFRIHPMATSIGWLFLRSIDSAPLLWFFMVAMSFDENLRGRLNECQVISLNSSAKGPNRETNNPICRYSVIGCIHAHRAKFRELARLASGRPSAVPPRHELH
jgi:hypothetical protein